jgi:hypothetical protein
MLLQLYGDGLRNLRKNGWTASDVELLREYAEKGCSVYRAAAVLRRTVASVRSKAAKEGLRIANGKAVRSGMMNPAAQVR